MTQESLQHELISAVKNLAIELGRTPTHVEFESRIIGGQYRIGKAFGTFTGLLQAAGLDTYSDRRSGGKQLPGQRSDAKLIRQYKALCSKREQIQGFFRSTLDLSEMFSRAGNPPILRLSVQGDTHAKFVDRPAFNSYLSFLRFWKPHAHLIIGDFADCEGLSHWPEESLEPRRIVPEMKIARGLLQELVDSTPEASTRIFLEGNHENWIAQAFTKMPELFDGLAELDIEISVQSLLGLKKYGYDFFPLNEIVKIGNANFTHGIYTGQHHAKKHLDVFKESIYYGHIHDVQEFNDTSMDGHLEAACVACLCRLDAKFLKGKPNKWVHGHRAFEFFPDGSYNSYNLRIFNGRTAYMGKVFE